tara:strand:- start:235 stop:408 length:174 start_codon:yes stop_codon:yes gene_type:complete
MAKWTLPVEELSAADLAELISDSQLLKCLQVYEVHAWERYNEAHDLFENLTNPERMM